MYAQLCRKHLEPAPFGAITLDRLRPTDIEALVLKLKDRELSDSTVRSVYTVLRLALDGAVRDGLLARNPAAVVKRPGLARREAKHATAVDVTALLKAADGLRYRDVLLLIAATGMRRGEALALRWSDVDLDNGPVTVRGTLGRMGGRLVVSEPKTDRSRRTVPMCWPYR
jgi:integrase